MKTAEEWAFSARELVRNDHCQGRLADLIAAVQRDAIEAARLAMFDACYQRIEEMPNGPTCDGAQWAVATGCAAIRALAPVRP